MMSFEHADGKWEEFQIWLELNQSDNLKRKYLELSLKFKGV